MSASQTRFVQKCAQWVKKERWGLVPKGTRGIYALLQFRPSTKTYDVVYIGMAPRSGIRGRLMGHYKDKKKTWSHFSIFKVWENISENEVQEIEGLFREIYSKDTKANLFNKQKKYKKFLKVHDLRKWRESHE